MSWEAGESLEQAGVSWEAGESWEQAGRLDRAGSKLGASCSKGNELE